MSHPSKTKGNGYERELVNQAIESGLEAKRAWGSNGEALGEHETVDILLAGKRIQAKRRKSIAGFLKVNEHQDALVLREDRGESYVVITWWEYLDLLKGLDNSEKLFQAAKNLVKSIDNWKNVQPVNPQVAQDLELVRNELVRKVME